MSDNASRSNDSIAYVKIHPSIGIARLGNHPTAYFVGPEKPHEYANPSSGFKADDNGELKVKRQAARFRLFGYNSDGNKVKEITNADADIEWTVTLANKKASWEGHFRDSRDPLRNAQVPPDKRAELIIGPKTVILPGDKEDSKRLGNSSYLSYLSAQQHKTVKNIYLGELRIDESGRALVLGGEGRSESPIGARLEHYANNPGWFDDVADGPIDAKVTLHENGARGPSKSVSVKGAWVITAPPNFAPSIQAVVTMYDMLYDRAIRDTLLSAVSLPETPSFSEHIYPLLEAALNVQHISARTNYHSFSDLLDPNSSLEVRETLLSRLRVPKGLRSDFRDRVKENGNMPKIFDSNNSWKPEGSSEEGFTLTESQYRMLVEWAEGKVDIDGPNGQPPENITPEGLDRAALMNCVGGAFYPGIEAGWFLESPTAVEMDGADFLRIKRNQRLFGDSLEAGDITKQMAVPWQADFSVCHVSEDVGWWPSARPDKVNIPGGGRLPWDRDIGPGGTLLQKMKDMKDGWWKLGFVVQTNNGFVEVDRS